ncbi:MAG TPA: hypothetical protein VMR73_02200 [Candidatus Paceibacterota bacterium]|nr:hypothetical protein [Candidatus Paceibacterota bacterium]
MKIFSITGWQPKRNVDLSGSVTETNWAQLVKGYKFSGILAVDPFDGNVCCFVADEAGFGAIRVVSFDQDARVIILRVFKENRYDSVDYIATYDVHDDCWHCRPKDDINGSVAIKFVLRDLPVEFFVPEEIALGQKVCS